MQPSIGPARAKRGIFWWFPFLVGAMVIGGVVCLWRVLAIHERLYIAQTIQLETARISDQIRLQMEGQVRPLMRLSDRLQKTSVPKKNFLESEVSFLLQDYPGYKAIEWDGPSLDTQWKWVSEEQKRDPLLEEKVYRFCQANLTAIRPGQRVVLSHAMTLGNGSKIIMVSIPMVQNGTNKGCLVGIFECRQLFDHLLEHVAPGYSLVVLDRDQEIFGRYEAGREAEMKWGEESFVRFGDVMWRVRAWPSPFTLANLQSPVPDLVLLSGAVVAALLMFCLHFTRVAREDVEERKKIQVELDRQREELIRSNSDLEQFAYVASHDLQEPLRMVGSFAQLLARKYHDKMDGEAQEFINYMTDGVNQMRTLILDLLEYSRLGRKSRVVVSSCENALQKALSNLQVAIREAGATVTHDPLPEVMSDSTQLFQLFQNLVGNAIKFHGKEPPRIHVSVERKNGSEWVFSVRDNGIGIDPQFYQRIFVIFQRLHGKNEYAGTGIGLALCKKIVENLGGKIWVDSAQGKGSIFYFTLPVIK